MIIGIDASNIRAGGGVTHLVEFLKAAKPFNYGISKIIVWGGTATLSRIDNSEWLEKIHDPLLDKSLPFRLFWASFRIKKIAKLAGCDLLFVPGGSDASNFKPMVTMSQNLLPFEWRELRRYGWTAMTLKGILLRYVQGSTFRRAQGVIFLTKYAQHAAIKVTGTLEAQQAVIAHGINPMFNSSPDELRYKIEFTKDRPCRVLYVSGLEPYKHQWHVAEAVSKIFNQNKHIVLDLVGPVGPGLKRLTATLKKLDPTGSYLKFRGPVAYDELKYMYTAADVGVFASSCETFGQILTEAMSAGLPMACSNRSAMPELLGDAGIYFNPESPDEIAASIEKLMNDEKLRSALAMNAYQKSKVYTWERCAKETLSFLAFNARKFKDINANNLKL